MVISKFMHLLAKQPLTLILVTGLWTDFVFCIIYSALHTAIHNQQWEPFKKILETVETSPDISYLVNEPNLKNMTPLALAVSTNCLPFVEELIKHNADVSIPNSDGDNPLHIAVKLNNLEIVESLLESKNANSVINKCNHSSKSCP